MAQSRPSIILHLDSLDILDKLTAEQGLELFKAIRDYNQGKKLELSQIVDIVFTPFKNQFDRDCEKYNNICERNKANGKKGGRPKNPNNPTPFLETQENPKNLKSKSKSKSKNKNKSKELLLDTQIFIDEGYKEETLNSLIEHRRDVVKKPLLTNRMMRGLLDALTEYYKHWKITPDEAVEYYLTKTWTSIDPEYKYPHRKIKQIKETDSLSYSDISKSLKERKNSTGMEQDSKILNLTKQMGV
jgi:hypothetical protein